MHSSDWDGIRYFLAAARHGSFAAAGRALDVEHTTVARRVTALEARLGARLFERLRSGLRLTRAGEEMLARAAEVEARVQDVDRLAGTFDHDVGGEVILATSAVLASALIVPALSALRAAHPAITLTLVVGRSLASLPRREADVALRLRPAGMPAGSSEVVAARLGVAVFSLFGSAAYLRRRPAFEAAPERHRLLRYGRVGWEPGRAFLEQHPAATVGLHADDMPTLRAACEDGHGLAVLPRFFATRARLREVIAAIDSASVFAAVHPDLRRVPRVRAVLRWLREEVGPQVDGTP